MKNHFILFVLSLFVFGCTSDVTKVTWDDAKSIALKPGANVSIAVIPIFSIIAFFGPWEN